MNDKLYDKEQKCSVRELLIADDRKQIFQTSSGPCARSVHAPPPPPPPSPLRRSRTTTPSVASVRPPSPVIPVARHTFPWPAKWRQTRQDVDRAMNSHLLFPPPQMTGKGPAAHTQHVSKTGDGSKPESSDDDLESETATKHIAEGRRFSKRVSRNAPRRTVRTAHPPHCARLFVPSKNAYVLTHLRSRCRAQLAKLAKTKHIETASDDIPDDRFKPVSRTHPAAFPPHCPPTPRRTVRTKTRTFYTLPRVVAHSWSFYHSMTRPCRCECHL